MTTPALLSRWSWQLVCSVCGEAVAKDQLERQVEFSHDGSSPGPDIFHIHISASRHGSSSATKTAVPQVARCVMNDLFRTFLDGVSARGGYCLDCLSEMYGEPARIVTRYLSEIRVSGRLGTCANCDEEGETFRSDLSS